MKRVPRASRSQPERYVVRLRLDRRQAERQLHALRASLLADHADPKDATDQCVETFATEVDAAVLDLEAASLRRIDEALRHVAAGCYGVCAECGGQISAARLRAMPFADLCRLCQGAREAAAARAAAAMVRT